MFNLYNSQSGFPSTVFVDHTMTVYQKYNTVGTYVINYRIQEMLDSCIDAGLCGAVDFDNDGRTDIWQTKADVFASASNYLVGSGWVNGETWGRKVRITKPIDSSLISMDVIKSLKEWHELGIRRVSGEKLPIFNMSGSLIRPGSDPDNVFLVYQNYRAILRWNRSHYFGLAVGRLADSIR